MLPQAPLPPPPHCVTHLPFLHCLLIALWVWVSVMDVTINCQLLYNALNFATGLCLPSLFSATFFNPCCAPNCHHAIKVESSILAFAVDDSDVDSVGSSSVICFPPPRFDSMPCCDTGLCAYGCSHRRRTICKVYLFLTI